jgi:hypothetical protein
MTIPQLQEEPGINALGLAAFRKPDGGVADPPD